MLSLSATPGFPAGFDPALTHCMCNFPLAGYAAVPGQAAGLRDAVDRQLHMRPRRVVDVTDASGETVVHLEAHTTLTVSDGQITVVNYMTGFSRLPAPVLEATVAETLVPGAPGTAVGVAQHRVTLETGDALEGLTVVPYRFNRTDALVSAAVRSIEQTCHRLSAADMVLRASSRWETSAVLPASTGA